MSRKKVRLNSVDVDPEQFAIVVVYTTEVSHFDESGALVGQESVPGRKVIKVPRGMQPEEIPGLAQEVVEKCKYISASRVGEVEMRLQQLQHMEMQMMGEGGQQQQFHQQQQQQHHHQQQQQQQHHQQQRHQHQHNGGAPPPPPPGGGGAYHQEAHWQQAPPERPAKPPKRQEPLLPDADIRMVETYQDQLYEEVMDNKVAGSKRILRLCTEPANLELLADHDTLLGVLSRELKENLKRSVDLSVSIVCSFLCFSNFSQFHPVLMQHQCGNVIMRVFEYESERHQVRKAEMERRTMRFKELGENATLEDKKLQSKDEKKYKLQLNRQNKLMFVALIALQNLAEEIATERKMVNRKMPQLLGQVLERNLPDLLLVTLQFMKKLSVFEENKDQMATKETLTRLVELASHEDARVAVMSLKILYNFSFDEALRGSLIESGVVPLLIDLLRNPPFRHIVLKLLYQFSIEDRCKSMMAYHRDGMIMLLQLVVHFPESRVGKDLVALMVNLSTHARAAEVIVGSGLFPQVMVRVLKTRDPLLCKVIRHCSGHPAVIGPMHELLQSNNVRMSKWMHEFVRMGPSCLENTDLLVEVLGTLANVTLEEIPWGELCEAGLVDLLTRLLVPGFSEDDIVLECAMMIGNMALMQESAQYLASSRVPSLLQQVLVEKRDDPDVIAQSLYTFQCLLVFEDVRQIVLEETELAPCIMAFARSTSPTVLEQASRLLQQLSDFMGEGGQDWAEQIKAFRFEQHNAEWCRFVARENSGSLAGSPGYYDDGSPTAEEEEFHFRCANGYAMDAAALADRDWGNQDMAELMRTSRHMALS